MRNRYIEAFEAKQIGEKKIPDFKAGDTLRLAVEIKEGEKKRIQNFEGVCISYRGEGLNKTFIVRKIVANSIGIERISPLYSESLKDIKVLKRGRVRRSKLYYLRERKGKSARIRELKK